MTNEEKLAILDEAIKQSYLLLKQDYTEAGDSKDLVTLLDNLSNLEWMANRLREEKPETVAEKHESHAPVAKETVTPEPPATAKATMTKEEVRDKLSTYSNKYDSLDVAAIMSEMGYGKLSDIPATRYAELIERVEASIKEGA